MAWQAQFLSYILLILRNNLYFKDKQMILQALLDISTNFRFQKNLKSSAVQVIQWFMAYIAGDQLCCSFGWPITHLPMMLGSARTIFT